MIADHSNRSLLNCYGAVYKVYVTIFRIAVKTPLKAAFLKNNLLKVAIQTILPNVRLSLLTVVSQTGPRDGLETYRWQRLDKCSQPKTPQ